MARAQQQTLVNLLTNVMNNRQTDHSSYSAGSPATKKMEYVCLRESCQNKTTGLLCSKKCMELYLNENKQNAYAEPCSSPCTVCPYRRDQPDFMAMRGLLIEQMHLNNGISSTCMAAKFHCGLRKACKGQKIAVAGGNDNVYSTEEFLRKMPVNSEIGAVVYLRRLMGYFPSDIAVLDKNGDVCWSKNWQKIKTSCGIPVDAGLSMEMKRAFVHSFNRMVEVGLQIEKTKAMEQKFLNGKVG